MSKDAAALDKARYWASQAREPVKHYEHVEMGYNYRLSSILAAIGIAQLSDLGCRVEKRRQIYSRYDQQLSGIEGVAMMPEAEMGRATRWLTALTIDPEVVGITAADIVLRMELLNIECRQVWKPMHLQPLFKGAAYYEHKEGHSVSDKLFEHGICLPSGSGLTEIQQERVVNGLLTCLCAVVK